jgi:hypothetical protein
MAGLTRRAFSQALKERARPAELDRDILALDEAALLQTAVKRLQQVHGILGRTRAHESDDRHRLLRARRERPRSCRAAEQRNELAPLQSIELHGCGTWFSI